MLRATTDFPPHGGNPRHQYDRIDRVEHYWGDTVGVLREPSDYPTRRMAVVRTPIRWWANRAASRFVSSAEAERLHEPAQPLSRLVPDRGSPTLT